MRKLIYGINISLDGCCDHTKFSGSEEILDYFRELTESVDLIIYGRKTFELMVPYWPDVVKNPSSDEAANAYARAFSSVRRVLVSGTANSVDEQTTLIRDNLRDEIMKLKQQPGGAISTGGVELPAQLIEWGLVDEFHMVVHPVLVGAGRRLFAEMQLPENQGLKLVGTEVLTNGFVVLRYEKG